MKIIHIRSVALLSILTFASPARAVDIDNLVNINQGDFRKLSEDAGAAFSYHPQTPTEPLGITGFDVGLSLTLSTLANKDAWVRASSSTVPDLVPIPTLRANKGLPMGVDVGLMFAMIPQSNVKLWGGEARWAFIEGGIAAPAVGVRGSFTKLQGVNQLDMTTKGLDISASKGFANLTPYIGIGRVWVSSDPHVLNLSREDFGLNKFFFGAGFNLLTFNLNAEFDRTGESTAYSLKAGMRF